MSTADSLKALDIVEREITLLEQELLDPSLSISERAAIQARLGNLTLLRDRLAASLVTGAPPLPAPSAADLQKLQAASTALDQVAAGQARASAIIDTVAAAIQVFAT